MKYKKRFLVLLTVACIVLSLSGCINSSDNEKTTELATVEKSVEETTKVTFDQPSDFDFNQVFENVEVNGKHIPFPFTLNDLGDGFEVRTVTEMGDGNCCGTLYYNDKMVAGIFMKIDSRDKFSDITEVYRITLYDSYEQIFAINGINCKYNINNVKDSINGLEEYYNDNNELIKLEKNMGNTNYLIIYSDMDNGMITIDMAKGE